MLETREMLAYRLQRQRVRAPTLGMPWYTCLDMVLDNVVVVGVRGCVRGGGGRGGARAARRLLRICSSICLTCWR